MRLTYNSAIAASTATTVNYTTSCSGGGSIALTGTVSAASGTTTIDLSYLFDKCKFENTYSVGTYTSIVKLTLTGTITRKGTIPSSGGSSHTSSGTAIKMDGTVQNNGYTLNNPYPYSNSTCDFQRILTSTSVSGSLCGKTFTF